MNEKIEKFTHNMYFILVKITAPGLMIPNLIIGYFNYFTTDLGSEAFHLPYMEWYV